ncbi:MAG: hypothetical protein ACKVE4_02865 [Dissulfuribacterales bacterium]
MARLTLSHELLAACLILVDGNIDATIEDVLSCADDFQKEEDRHFGISDTDLGGLFLIWTTFEIEIRKYSEILDDIKLRDVIELMLDHHYAAFNDEGESMAKGDEEYDSFIRGWFHLDEEEYRKKMVVKNKMRIFFHGVITKDISGKEVMDFLNGMGITRDVLLECTRPGASS